MVIDQRTKEMKMVRGDSEMIHVRCADAPFESGDIIEFSVRKKPKSERLIHETVTDFIEGEAYIEISPSDTSSMEFGEYVYDIQLTRASGWVTTLVWTSPFKLETEVTYDG